MRAILVAAFALATLPFAASGAPRQKIAVLDIRAVQGVSPGTATILTAIVVDDAARGGFDVISQADVSAMIGFEKQKQMLGCSEDSSCLAEIGGALGVDYVLSGQVGQIGSRYHLSFQLLDSRRAKVAARAARFADRDEDALAAAAQATVAELLRAPSAPPRVAGNTPATATEPPGRLPAVTPPRTAPATQKPTEVAARPDLAARPASPEVVAAARPKRSFRPSRKLAWWTVGGGGALLAGGALFGLQAAAKQRELEEAWQQPDYATLYETRSTEAQAAAKAANLLYVAGAVTTGVGGWFLWKSRTPVVLAPIARDGELGLVASGRF